ncbi:universal stress protein [Alkalitalea saponilacus]|uniref:Nucleotide-binding universal stress protein, UspA family n=1 Tax=Alkalitalea saponilacus TaxID=889453 RepID=A0A1T5CJA1_9BACT|nr:universal stress protein [Alkalitalea saponilacus]ASB49885.1 universal stress protein UspA [Alkalitalea saponilacus]SKB59538.1 Nucleotide-binding universal stress protein, UspA family [Alkalitalea saponilacus]
MKNANIAILIDMSEMDNIILNYAKRLDESHHFNSIHLVHFVEVTEFPKEILEMYPDLDQPIENMIAEEIEEYKNDCLPHCQEKIKIHVHGGGDMETFLEWMEEHSFDLVIIGKKSGSHGSGIFSGKMVRLLSSNTLFVTEMARGDIHKIMVPIDFSNYTQKVLSLAKTSASLINAELVPVHALKMSLQYYPFVKNKEELEKMLQKEVEKKYEKLKQKTGISESCLVVNAGEQHISKAIYDQAIFQSIDLIILGNKGKADDSDLLIGSVAERMIAQDRNIPVMIVNK